MNVYFISYSSDYANTYTVYVADSDDAATIAELSQTATRISEAEGIERGWTRPREAMKTGESWEGRFADHGRGPEPYTLDVAITRARETTSLEIAGVY